METRSYGFQSHRNVPLRVRVFLLIDVPHFGGRIHGSANIASAKLYARARVCLCSQVLGEQQRDAKVCFSPSIGRKIRLVKMIPARKL